MRHARILIIAGAVVACHDSSPPSSSRPASSRDSAGIAIVENLAPAWRPGEEWTVDSIPALELGDKASHPITAASVRFRIFSNGTIGVEEFNRTEMPEVNLSLFDSTGRYLGSMSRRGNGPGEFTDQPHFASVTGDTIVCTRLDNRKLAWFTRDGRLIAQTTLSDVLFEPSLGQGLPLLWGIRADGTILFTKRAGDDMAQGLQDEMVAVYALRDSGRTLIRYGEFGLRHHINSGSGGSASPFEQRRSMRIGADPFPLAVAGREHWEIQHFGVDGRLRRLVRARIPRPVPTPELQEWGRKEGFDPPDSLPAVGLIYDDRDGHLWVSRAGNLGGTTDTFDIVSIATGRWLGTVRLPMNGYLEDISKDYVGMTAKDSLDSPIIRLHRIRRPAGSRNF